MRVRAAAAVVALFAGGCTGPADTVASGTVPAPARGGAAAPAVHQRWTSCAEQVPATADFIEFDAGQDALTMPLLDDGFRPVAAVVCRTGERPGAGVEEARAGDPAVVLPALRLPDEPRTTGICTMEMPAVPWLALLDDSGRWIRPGIPADACGKPRMEFRDAYDKLATVPVRSRVRQPG